MGLPHSRWKWGSHTQGGSGAPTLKVEGGSHTQGGRGLPYSRWKGLPHSGWKGAPTLRVEVGLPHSGWKRGSHTQGGRGAPTLKVVQKSQPVFLLAPVARYTFLSPACSHCFPIAHPSSLTLIPPAFLLLSSSFPPPFLPPAPTPLPCPYPHLIAGVVTPPTPSTPLPPPASLLTSVAPVSLSLTVAF